MSKTAYEIESELKGSAVDRTGFGGRPELINFYVESTQDLSALPMFDSLTIDALRCGKIIPVATLADNGSGAAFTTIPDVRVAEDVITFVAGQINFVYTIATKTWALGS